MTGIIKERARFSASKNYSFKELVEKRNVQRWLPYWKRV